MFLARNFRHICRICSRAKSDQGIIDMPLDIPSGESDLSMKTRVSFLSQEMADDARHGIRGMSPQGFRMFDMSFLFGPIVVFPSIALSWRVAKPEDITPESLKLLFMLQPKLDVLVIGVGNRKNLDKVRKQVIDAIHNEGIGLEIAPTDDAVPTFNWLNAEYRSVAGCFYPDDELEVSKIERIRSMALVHQNYDKMPEPPLNELLFYKDQVHRALERIYGNTDEMYKAREFINKIQEEDMNHKLQTIKEKRLELANQPRSDKNLLDKAEETDKSLLEEDKKKE